MSLHAAIVKTPRTHPIGRREKQQQQQQKIDLFEKVEYITSMPFVGSESFLHHHFEPLLTHCRV